MASPPYLQIFFPLKQPGFDPTSASISILLTPLQVCWKGRLNCTECSQLSLNKLVNQISKTGASTKPKLRSVNAAHSKSE